MPLRAIEAKKLARLILTDGSFVITQHAREEMAKRELCDIDALNVVRAGNFREAEYENGAWRYQAYTPVMTFVIEFDPEPEGNRADDVDVAGTELVIVTGWRVRR